MGIARVFFDQALRYGIPGLTELLKSKRVSQKAIQSSDMTMFVNSKRTIVKIFWGGNYLLTFSKGKGEGKITADEIRAIPDFFKGGMTSNKLDTQIRGFLDHDSHIYIDEDGVKST